MVATLYLAAFISLLLLTAALALQFRRREARWRADLKRLADIKYALDQAVIVATTDVKGRITYVNDKFVEISGYSREELLGQDHRLLNSGLHPKAFIQDMWRTIANGQVWHGEFRNRAKDGHHYWVDTTIVPFLNGRGKPYQYTAIRSDITLRKAAEERLREQGALARIGQMAAVVAHEVKNPLAGIKGVMQVLAARRPPGDPEQAVMADIISRIDALNELIHDMLLYARPRALRVQPIDLASLLHQAVEVVRRDPAAREVDVELQAEPLTLQGDIELLKAVFLNLLINAAQAMSGRGRIDVQAAAGDGTCRIQIVDNGPGIDAAIRDKIFEPFFTTKSRGGGLGLPIARRTVELHGGTLAIHSAPGEGTRVAIELPRTPPVTRAESPVGAPAA
ncbi:MAG: nitrogen regulation protein NR(II) [Vicinamibacterales bacterium]